jgi:hypothetical protein
MSAWCHVRVAEQGCPGDLLTDLRHKWCLNTMALPADAR